MKDKGTVVNWKETIVDVSIYFFVILSLFEAVILSYWILLALGVIETSASLGQELVKQEANIFYITAVVAPIMFTITIFSWLSKPVLNIISKTKLSHRFQNKSLSRIQHIFTLQEQLDRRDVTLLVLLCSMAAATLLALFPYSPALNPNLRTIGTDTNDYASIYLARMESQSSLLETVTYTFTKFSDRALGLLFMYAFHQIIGGSRLAVSMFFPILLAPLTVLSTYIFVREARFSNTVASLTVIFTAFSYYLVTGTVAGLLSNWMAIIEIYIFSGLFIKSIRQNSTFYGFMAALIGVLVFFTHGSSWTMLMGVIVVYGLIQIIRNHSWKGILSYSGAQGLNHYSTG